MSPEQFRHLALSMPEAREGAHMQHADFRANDRIFASLPDRERGMVKLPLEDQSRLVAAHPGEFVPANGAWGRAGCTYVQLAGVDAAVLRDAMTLAWQVAMQRPGTTRGKRASSKPALAKKPKAKKANPKPKSKPRRPR